MSTALVQSFEQLLLIATARLTAEIQAEKDPKRLETLLTLAFRAKIPRALTPTSEPKPRRTPQRNEHDGAQALHSTPSAHSAPSTPSIHDPATATDHLNDPSPRDDLEDESLRDYEPMTDEEVEKLERQIGFIEANRRRIQYFQLAYKTAMRKARLATANSS